MTDRATAPCVILNEPQLAENIGSVARVMANFGLEDLRMVRPRDGWPQERAWVGVGRQLAAGRRAGVRQPGGGLRRPSPALCHHRAPARGGVADHHPAGGGGRTARGGRGGAQHGPAVRRRTGRAGDPGHRALPGRRDHPHRPALPFAEPGPGGGHQRLRVAHGRGRGLARRRRSARGRRPPTRPRCSSGLYGHLEGELDAAGFFHPDRRSGRPWSGTCAPSSPAPC